MSKEEVIKALNTEVLGDVGEHEWNNTWIDFSFEDFYMKLDINNYTLLGYFWLQEPKAFIPSIPLDIGLVCEDSEGYRFWCHTSKKLMEEMTEDWRIINEKKL